MKKHEDFMKLTLSTKEALEIYFNSDYNYEECKDLAPYSKIIVQYKNVDDYESFEDFRDEICNYIINFDIDYENLKYYLYGDDENSFDEVCKILINENCDIYQLLIEVK